MLDHAFEDHDEMLDREAVDAQSERARELLHATAVRFCPACGTQVLAKHNGECVSCDGPTTLAHRPVGAKRTGLVPARSDNPLPPALPSAPGVRGDTGRKAA